MSIKLINTNIYIYEYMFQFLIKFFYSFKIKIERFIIDTFYT